MSRIGKKPIEIPEKTEIIVSENTVSVKGPLGQLSIGYNPDIEIKVEERKVVLAPKKNNLQNKALWGTYSSLITGMIEGVHKEFVEKLIIEGVGFRAEVKGNILVLSIGFSHRVEMLIPDGIKVLVEKELITISGIDKQLVGQFTADVRAKKKPEPYKGKGIRYQNEVIRRKEGKKTV